MDMTISFAASLNESCQAVIQKLALPHLSQYIRTSKKIVSSLYDEFDFIPPHEQARTSEQILITPCHWAVGIDNIRMGDPNELKLTGDESQALLNAIQSFFLEDGIELTYETPLRWIAKPKTPQLIELESLASLDRVIGRHVEAWLPPLPKGRPIRRLQNEIQMLLYTHPINDTRTFKGLQTVNSFWVSRDVNLDTSLLNDLRSPALANDWDSWQSAWQKIDQLIAHDSDVIPRITLCGERQAITYYKDWPLSFKEKIKHFLKPAPSIQSVLASL